MTDYLRNPDLIYQESFATIRAEADLSRLPPELHEPAIRMIHACGMVDLAADIEGDPAVVAAAREALRRRARRCSAIARWCAPASSSGTCPRRTS